MAETQTPQKRPQEYSGPELDGSGEASKRQKPYNNVLNLLDDAEEEVEPSHQLSHDLLAIFTTLQQELSSSVSPPSAEEAETELDDRHITATACIGGDGDEGLKLSVMRHLLEASDDELGIPNRSTDEVNFEELNSGENIPSAFNDVGQWEFEDEAANYYTILQSELFM